MVTVVDDDQFALRMHQVDDPGCARLGCPVEVRLSHPPICPRLSYPLAGLIPQQNAGAIGMKQLSQAVCQALEQDQAAGLADSCMGDVV